MPIIIPCQSIWTNEATRTWKKIRSNDAVRAMTTFEVLDYDSRTYVKVNGERVHVVGLIYKKVVVVHRQYRRYSLLPDVAGPPPTAFSISSPEVTGPYINPDETNLKDTKMESRPVWYLDSVPAADYHDHSGTRQSFYKLYLLIGTQTYTLDLGDVQVMAYGRYSLEGTDKQLKEGTAPVDEIGPTFEITGERLYGVSVNVGKKAFTYSYDVEEYKGGPFTELDIDSPINVEDYNNYWTKKKRIVGAINYYGVSDQKEYSYEVGEDGKEPILPDTVMAVGYMDTRR